MVQAAVADTNHESPFSNHRAIDRSEPRADASVIDFSQCFASRVSYAKPTFRAP
jgi:hypothetical protein